MELIKKVRQATGAGINDVKKALEETNGNEPAAVDYLRKQGQKIAAKKNDRLAKEGVITSLKQNNRVAIVALACETDFVALNADFLKAGEEMAGQLLKSGEENFGAWAQDKIQNELIVKIGENIKLAHFAVITGEVIGVYVHSDRKLAAAVVLSGGSEELAKEVALQITAMDPAYLKPEDVPEAELDKEKEIYLEQLKKEGKPAEIIDKILAGKIRKYYSEVCLLKQPYIKDEKISIEKLLGDVKVEKFIRFSL